MLSDSSRRKQYDSSRTFGDFTNQFKGKAQQGTYNYQEYSSVYEQMSPEQQEQVRMQANAWLKRMAMYAAGFVLFWWMFTRRPHRSYALVNGNLIPFEVQQPYPQAGMGYPQQQMYQTQGPAPYPSPYNYTPPAGGMEGIRHHSPPQYNQNPYPLGKMQSNYSPLSAPQAPQAQPQ